MRSLSDNVDVLVLTLPTYDIGQRVRSIFVNKLKGNLPGSFSTTHESFRSIFFPHYQNVQYEGDIKTFIGLDESWWNRFSVAVLVQSMNTQTSKLKRQLKTDTINQEVNSHGQTLFRSADRFYGFILRNENIDIKNALSAIGSSISEAKDMYKNKLLEGVQIHKLWFADGQWKHSEWELYHHYIKLQILGATDQEIHDMIIKLKSLGLPINSQVTEDNWKSYSDWNMGGYINHSDVDDEARNAELKEGLVGFEILVSINEVNSLEFTAIGQPGENFRSYPTEGSCFSSDTKVLIHDGSLRSISDIKKGDMVKTLKGDRKVAFVATPPLGNRKMFSINDLPFGFTGSHPFYNFDMEISRYLAVHPDTLSQMVPTLNKYGIASLVPTRRLSSVTLPDLQIHPYTVNLVKEFQYDQQQVYDVILEPSEDNISSDYIVGTENIFFNVASEIPLTESELTNTVFLTTMSKILHPQNRDIVNSVMAIRTASPLSIIAKDQTHPVEFIFNTKSIYNAARQLQMDNIKKNWLNPNLLEFVDSFQSNGNYDHSAGYLYELILKYFGEILIGFMSMSWRLFLVSDDYPTDASLSVSVSQVVWQHLWAVDESVKMEISLGNETISSSPISFTPFLQNYNTVGYFKENAKDGTNRIINFKFFTNSGVIAHATGYLPNEFKTPYCYLQVTVWKGNCEVGELQCDVRVVSSALIDEENERKKRWTDMDKLQYAQHFGTYLGLEMENNFKHLK